MDITKFRVVFKGGVSLEVHIDIDDDKAKASYIEVAEQVGHSDYYGGALCLSDYRFDAPIPVAVQKILYIVQLIDQ